MAAIPRFDLPFRYSGGKPAVVEQDSPEDIANCVFAVCASEPGQYYDAPGFGLPDMVGEQLPLDPQSVINPILRCEPRASVLVEVNPERFNEAVVNANVQVG